MSIFKEINLTGQKKYSIKNRPSKIGLQDFSNPQNISVKDFWKSLPPVLKIKEMNELLEKCVLAFQKRKPVIIALGGHVIKCGLSPFIIDLLKMGLIKGLAANGSVVIHDLEIAKFGKTSEDVATALEDGSFGMVSETNNIINAIIVDGAEKKLGYGEAIGKHLNKTNAPNNRYSLVGNAYQNKIPSTVHIALGTDINHQHETANGAAIGDCSLRDFRIFCNNLIEMNDGGVFLNFGSAVILPEVFLKAVTVVRNLGHPLKNFHTAVFDMNFHYRPQTNIVHRPTLSGGKGFYFIGHHEFMIPLFLLTLKERLQNA